MWSGGPAKAMWSCRLSPHTGAAGGDLVSASHSQRQRLCFRGGLTPNPGAGGEQEERAPWGSPTHLLSTEQTSIVLTRA